ncbi:MAG: cell division protein FtsQ/DivIB [Candidatus Krumholzibacteria bacterium]|nr:cell division protein FtsQ/DivIB [Candidatus Krumholzibacteria bacterium]
MRYWESTRMASRESSTRRRVSGKWLALAAGGLAAIAAVALWSGIFIITDVQFFGDGTIPQDSLKRIRAGLIGGNLVTVSFSDAREALLAFPEVRDAVFVRHPWHAVECRVLKREPVALLVAGDILEVDGEGVIIPRRAGKGDIDLPVITGIDPREIGKRSAARSIECAVEILGLFKKLGLSPAKQLSEIHISGEDIDLVWMGTGTLIRLGRDQYAGRVRKLESVLGILNDRERFPSVIDLRFDRQVVVR